MNDVWSIVSKGEKVTLMCLGVAKKGRAAQSDSPQTRQSEEVPSNPPKMVCRGQTAEEKRAAAQE